MQPRTGHVIGTDVDGRWWRRCSLRGFLARGNGRLWTDGRGIYFHRQLTRAPLFTAWSAIQSTETSTFHSGRWAWGLPPLKIWWMDGEDRLSSGVLVSGRRAAQLDALDQLRWEQATHAAGGGQAHRPHPIVGWRSRRLSASARFVTLIQYR